MGFDTLYAVVVRVLFFTTFSNTVTESQLQNDMVELNDELGEDDTALECDDSDGDDFDIVSADIFQTVCMKL